MRGANLALLGLFALVAAGAVLHFAEAGDAAGWIIVSLFAFWATVPYLMLGAVAFLCERVRAAQIVVTVGALLVAGFGLWSILQVGTSSTGALILIFGPLWQAFGATIFCAAALLLRARATPPPDD